LVKNLPEVKNWLNLFTGPKGTSPITGGKPVIKFDHMEEDEYVIRVYEQILDDGCTVTFDWFYVGLSLKEVKNGRGNRVFKKGIASWKTYRNEENDCEIKYPLNWEVVNSETFQLKPELTTLRIVVTEISKGKELKEYLEELDKERLTTYEGTHSVDVLSQEEIELLGFLAI
jgi:hypothetical protein